jgi:hypothetical protein
VNTTSASNLSLSFDYENEDFAGDGNFIVEVFDGAVWQQVFIVEQDQSGSEIINVTAYSNANFQVRYCYDVETETNTSLIWGCAVDNHIVQNVLCAQAENLAATNPNNSGATISWTDPNDPDGLSYDIEFIVSGNPPTGTPTVTDVPNPYIWTGATQGLEYDVYVRINCSAGMSTWAGPVTFLALDPPANDLCSGAIAVDVGVGMCGTTANGDNNATTDSGEGTPSCGTYAGGDIWYSFVAPASGAIALTTLTENWTSPYIGVYSGSCGSLVEVYCNLVSTTSDEIITGLAGGATYYLRWWDSGNNNFGSISFCLTSGDAPPNDDCANAISVTVGAEGGCGPSATGNNNFASDSGEGSPSCGSYAGGDLWYSFVAPASGGVILEVILEDWTSPYGAVYSGGCGTLVEVGCELLSTTSTDEFTGLTPGATHYIRVWDSGNNNYGDIEFCLEASPFPPPNDDCGNAVEIPIGAIGSCPGGEVNGTTTAATDDGFTSCDGVGSNNGVWYYFTAPAGGEVNFEITELSGNHEAAIFDACGGTEVFCSITPNNIFVTGLTPSATYYMLVWSDAGSEGDHTICGQIPPMPPPNDLCANATNVQVGIGACGPSVTGTNISATDSGEGAPSCGTYAGGDIWYVFTAPPSGDILMYTLSEDWTSPYIAVYSGNCGSLVEVYCSLVTTSSFEEILGLTGGATYYLRTWDSGNNNFGDIEFCLQEVPPPPQNDLCVNATAVQVGIGACGPSVTGTNISATDSGEGAPSCGTYSGGDIWYVFTAPPSGDVLMYTLAEDWTSPYIGVYSGNCGSLVEVYCNLVTTSSPEEILGLTGGATYYLRTWDSGNNNFGDIEFCLQEVPPPPANDLCANAIAINVEAFGDCPANAVSGSTISATDDGFTSCDGVGINNGVWYSFVAPSSEINLQVVEVSGNHEVAIYDACGGTEVFCDITPNNEAVTGLIMGNTYYLLLWSDSGNEGMFELCLQGPPPIPANDLCGNAEVLNAMSEGMFSLAGTTLGATTTDAPAACDANVDNSSVGGVWYQINTDNSFDVTVQVCDADYDTELSLYSGSCGALVCLAGDDDGCDVPNTLGSMIQLSAGTFLQGGENKIEVRSAPTTLYAYVTGHAANSGNFTIEVIVAQVVPLELISFTAKAEQHGNVLKWVTAQEQNTEVHLVQRLRNTADSPWETIGKVDAAGFSSSVVEYEWIDETPQKRSGYRILTRDFDGTEHLSPIVTVYRDNAHEKLELLNLYPQPVDSKIIFVDLFSPAEGNLEYEIIDLQGRKLIKNHKILSEGYNTLDMATGDLSSGLYILIMRNGETTMVRKITIK